MFKPINLLLLGLGLLLSSVAMALDQPKPEPMPTNGDGDFFISLNSRIYQTKIDTHNQFGVVKASPAFYGDVKLAQQFSPTFRPYLLFGDSITDVNFPFTSYRDIFFKAAVGTDIFLNRRIKLDVSLSFVQQLYLTEEENIATYYKDIAPYLNLEGDFSAIKSKHIDLGLGAVAIIATGNSHYGATFGYGAQVKIFLKQTYGNFNLNTGIYIQDMKFRINQTDQNTLESGVLLGVGLKIPYQR